MNREILFRGLRVDGKGWVEGQFFYWKRYGKNIPIIGDGVQNGSVIGHEVHPDTVGQYIKTINDEKYFDGYIFSIRQTEYKYFVRIEDGEAIVYHLTKKEADGSPMRWGLFIGMKEHDFEKDMHIIGNIHEKEQSCK